MAGLTSGCPSAGAGRLEDGLDVGQSLGGLVKPLEHGGDHCPALWVAALRCPQGLAGPRHDVADLVMERMPHGQHLGDLIRVDPELAVVRAGRGGLLGAALAGHVVAG